MITTIVLIVGAVVLCLIAWFAFFSDNIEKRIAAGFPEAWEKILNENVSFYHRLSEEQKERFRKRVHYFILSKPIYSHNTDIDDKIRVLVASSATIFTLSFDDWDFSYLKGILIVDQPIKHKEIGGNISGVARHMEEHCDVMLNKSALLHGFKNIEDKQNVGLHEFAHVLDHADGEVDGVPSAIMPDELAEKWTELMDKKIKDIKRRSSDIDPYGGTSKIEFFAVVTEYLFERPGVLKKKHPEVYRILSETFQQDPGSKVVKNLKKLMGRVKQKIERNQKCPCGSGKKFKKCCLGVA